MGLYQRGNNEVWWVGYTCKGKQYRISTGTSDKKLAKKIHAKIATQIEEGKWFERLPGEKKTLEELLDKYINEYSAHNKVPNSVRTERGMKKDIIKFFGKTKLKDVTRRQVSEYKFMCLTKGLKPSTVRARINFLRHAFNLAIREWEWVRENPAAMITVKVNNARDRWLTVEEESRLLHNCIIHVTCKGNVLEPRYWLQEIVLFALNTGMRQDEILSLEWTAVDFLRRTAMVVRSKNGEKRTLPLNNAALAVLKAKAGAGSANSGYVFLSEAGTKILARNLLRAFYGALDRAKIEDFRFHDLRHTFASRLAQAGVDFYKIAKLLGHKDIRMTQRYAHHYPESLRDGVEVLDEINADLSRFYHNQPQNERKGLRLVP